MLRKKTLKDLDIEKKNLVIRIDIDASFEDGEFLEMKKLTRYRDALDYVVNKKAKVILLFELGKNRVIYPKKISVKEIIDNLSQAFDLELAYFSGNSEKEMDFAIEEILPGEVLVWENLALNDDELNNSAVFNKLMKWADLYVNDAFGVSARSNYNSFNKLPKKVESSSGLVLNEEIEQLVGIFSKLERPFNVILGGLDIDSFMIDHLMTLTEKADTVLFTGAWISYYAWQLGEIEKEDWMDKKSLKSLEKIFTELLKKENVHFPEDVKVYKKDQDGNLKIANVFIDFIKKGLLIGDIGRRTLAHYKEIIEESRLNLCLGSIGKWWIDGLDDGTLGIASSMSRAYGEKIIVADDLIESLTNLGFSDLHRFSHIHYGDGESALGFLINGSVAGIDNLKNSWNI